MELLIDTHALIWFAENSTNLSTTARQHLESLANIVHYSSILSHDDALDSYPIVRIW